jgi:hypothetical protein
MFKNLNETKITKLPLTAKPHRRGHQIFNHFPTLGD